MARSAILSASATTPVSYRSVGTLKDGIEDYSLASSSIGTISVRTRVARWVQGSVFGRVSSGVGRVLWAEKQASLPTAGNSAAVLPVINLSVISQPSLGATS